MLVLFLSLLSLFESLVIALLMKKSTIKMDEIISVFFSE